MSQRGTGNRKMLATDFESGKYLDSTFALTLIGNDLIVSAVESTDIRDVKKMLVNFKGVNKALVVNHTNRVAMIRAFGNETDGWIGRTVRIEVTSRTYKGRPILSTTVVPQKSVEVALIAPIIDAEHEQAKKRGRPHK